MAKLPFVCFLFAVVLGFVAVACVPVDGGKSDVPAPTKLQTNVHYQWSAGREVDLLQGPAVPVRAYLESWLAVQESGSMAEAYPGFERAVAEATVNHGPDIFLDLLRPDAPRPPLSRNAIGNIKFLLQSSVRDHGGVTATVCSYRYGAALENANGSFSSVARTSGGDAGITVSLVRLATVDQHPPALLPPQSGPAVRPSVDVFGGWKIVGFLDGIMRSRAEFSHAWPTYETDLEICTQASPDPPERRALLTNGEHARTEFPTSSPSPGWPKGS